LKVRGRNVALRWSDGLPDPVNAHRIFDGKYLRCTVFGTAPALFATFDNFTVGKSGFSDCAPSRKVIAAGYRKIIIQTARNDWYLNAELEAMLETVCSLGNTGHPTKALGFSTGAFGALIFADALHMRELILVSPRFPRPMGWTGKARVNCPEAYLAPDWQDRLTHAAASAPASLILFDPRHFDDRMAARWLERTSAGMTTLAVPFGGHPCLQYINEAGAFGNLQNILLKQDGGHHGIFELKKAARTQSKNYRVRLTEYLDSRKSRAPE
jgi:hypothetical protein